MMTVDNKVSVPAHWKGSYQDSINHGVACNRKLIGARFFNRNMLLSNPIVVDTNQTLDTEGHDITRSIDTEGHDITCSLPWAASSPMPASSSIPLALPMVVSHL
jgi:hypothetical protein